MGLGKFIHHGLRLEVMLHRPQVVKRYQYRRGIIIGHTVFIQQILIQAVL